MITDLERMMVVFRKWSQLGRSFDHHLFGSKFFYKFSKVSPHQRRSAWLPSFWQEVEHSGTHTLKGHTLASLNILINSSNKFSQEIGDDLCRVSHQAQPTAHHRRWARLAECSTSWYSICALPCEVGTGPMRATRTLKEAYNLARWLGTFPRQRKDSKHTTDGRGQRRWQRWRSWQGSWSWQARCCKHCRRRRWSWSCERSPQRPMQSCQCPTWVPCTSCCHPWSWGCGSSGERAWSSPGGEPTRTSSSSWTDRL